MAKVYTTYEAKAKFSEIIARVRAGGRAIVTYRGRRVAEVRPIDSGEGSLEERLSLLEAEGAISQGPAGRVRLARLASRPGALGRFLESRE